MNRQYDFQQLCEIIAKLRAEDGCPWDREQTHDSLRNCMIEEAYEVVDGINQYTKEGDFDNLREELGDVLLQVVMHSQIAQEEGIFTMEDVIHEISEKMVRRHPHVFGDAVVENTSGVLNTWEAIKKEEKKGKKVVKGTFGIPEAFPALLRAQKVVKKCNKIENTVNTKEELFSMVDSDMKKLSTLCQGSTPTKEAKEAFGDVLYTISKLGLAVGIDAESCLAEKVKEEANKADTKYEKN